jgi:hypothetical protein
MKELLNAVGGKSIDQVIDMFIEKDIEIYEQHKDQIPYSKADYLSLHLIDLINNQHKLIKKLIKATLKTEINNIEKFAEYYNKRIAEETKNVYQLKLPALKKIELPKLKSI